MATSASYLRLLDVANRLQTPIKSPAVLARYLTLHGVKVSEQMMTNWKARGVSRDKSIDVATILNTTADYILYGKELGAQPAPSVQLVHDPVLVNLDALPPHEAEIFRIQIQAAADIQRAKQRAAADEARHKQEEDRAGSKKPPDDQSLTTQAHRLFLIASHGVRLDTTRDNRNPVQLPLQLHAAG